MLIEEIKSIKSSKKDLRNFGLTVGLVLGLLGGLFWWRDNNLYPYLLAISAFLIISGLIIPAILRPLQKAWMSLAVVLGWFMTRLLLSILFFITITPIRILAGLFGKKFLDLDFNKHKNIDSYWVPKDKVAISKTDCTKQF